MNNRIFSGLKALLVVGVCSLMVGCACKPSMEPRDVNVQIDNSLRSSDGRLKSVQVDMIAVSADELERWKMESLQNYWTPGKSLLSTSTDKVVMKFDPTENVPEKVFTSQDARWSDWGKKGAMDLVILADIPGIQNPQVGVADPRRQIITLNGCRWDSLDPIKINITSAGVVVLTQPKPEKK